MHKRILFPRNQIAERVQSLAEQIAKEYSGKKIVLIGVLDGSYIFIADLSRELFNAGLPNIEVEFIGVSSYAEGGTETSRTHTITKDLTTFLTDKHVLLVEDIVDTGLTLQFIHSILQQKLPLSIKTCVLLSKKARREIAISLDFVGFEIEENKWVEGYGLDTGHIGRANPDIVEL